MSFGPSAPRAETSASRARTPVCPGPERGDLGGRQAHARGQPGVGEQPPDRGASLFFFVAPALTTAIHWTIGLLLPYSFGLGFLIGPAIGLSGTPFIVAFAAGLVLFAWAMASIPSGPRPLR